MAVSYLSQPFRSSPYVLPIDLNVLDRVLTVKQGQFNANQAKLQNTVDQLGMLDVVKSEDRDYLNSKISNIVNGINNLGGVDYSEPGVLSQIEGLAYDVYGDKKVINAVSSSKAVRNLVNSYAQYKANPKLTKLYSEANEAYDMQKVNAYVNDGQVGSTYQGPTQATPYTPYRENHFKLFEKIKGDLTTNIFDKGYYILKETNERVTPDRLMAMAGDLLSPQEREQMKRDGWFLYRGAPPEALVDKSLQQFRQKVDESKRIVDEYDQLVVSAANDPEAKRAYTTLAENARNNYTTLKNSEEAVANSAAKALQTNPDEFYYQLYSNDYFRGLANRFSVNRVQKDLKPDAAQMFVERMQQSDNQFNERMKLEREKLDVEAMKSGLIRYTDPRTGQSSWIPLTQSDEGRFTSTDLNTENPEDLKVTPDKIEKINNDLTLSKALLEQDFFNKFIAENPDLGIDVQSKTPGGVARRLIGQEFLENINQQEGLQLSDLKGLQTPAVRGQLLSALQKQGVKDANTKLGILDRLYKNFQLMVEGKGVSVPELPDGFAGLMQQSALIDEKINANKQKLAAVYETVLANKGLTDSERATFQDYLTNKDKYRTTAWEEARALSPTSLFESNDFWKKYDEKIKNIQKIKAIKGKVGDFDKEVQSYLDQINTRDVYKLKTFRNTDPYIKDRSLQKYLVDEIKRQRYTPVLGSDKPDLDELNDLQVNPLSVGIAGDGSGNFNVYAEIKQGSGDKQKTINVRIPVDEANAGILDLRRDPYEAVNYSVNLLGKSGDLPVYGNKNLSLLVNIYKKNTRDLNDYSSFAKAKVFTLLNGEKVPDGKGGYKYQLINIPATDGLTPSESYRIIQEKVNQLIQLTDGKMTTDEFIKQLIEFKKP